MIENIRFFFFVCMFKFRVQFGIQGMELRFYIYNPTMEMFKDRYFLAMTHSQLICCYLLQNGNGTHPYSQIATKAPLFSYERYIFVFCCYSLLFLLLIFMATEIPWTILSYFQQFLQCHFPFVSLKNLSLSLLSSKIHP